MGDRYKRFSKLIEGIERSFFKSTAWQQRGRISVIVLIIGFIAVVHTSTDTTPLPMKHDIPDEDVLADQTTISTIQNFARDTGLEYWDELDVKIFKSDHLAGYVYIANDARSIHLDEHYVNNKRVIFHELGHMKYRHTTLAYGYLAFAIIVLFLIYTLVYNFTELMPLYTTAVILLWSIENFSELLAELNSVAYGQELGIMTMRLVAQMGVLAMLGFTSYLIYRDIKHEDIYHRKEEMVVHNMF